MERSIATDEIVRKMYYINVQFQWLSYTKNLNGCLKRSSHILFLILIINCMKIKYKYMYELCFFCGSVDIILHTHDHVSNKVDKHSVDLLGIGLLNF
jgi:hypothetical protein